MTGKKDREKSKAELITDLAELRLRLAASEQVEGAIKQSELVSRAASEYAENIVETVREPLIVLDSDLKVLSANQSFYDTFKVTPKESIGNLIYDLGNSQWDIPRLRTLLQDILPKDRKFSNFEVDHVFTSIGHRIMLLNARRIHREGIDPDLILLAIDDITEHKRLENELKDSEERFRRLFETAKDGLLLIDKQSGNIVNVNPAIIKLLGYTSEELIGKKLQNVGILQNTTDVKETIQKVIEYGFINYADVPMETKEGDCVDAEIYFVDRARFIQCNVRDITVRRRAEKKATDALKLSQAMIDASSIATLTYNASGQCISANEAAAMAVGASVDQLLLQNYRQLDSWRKSGMKDVADAALSNGTEQKLDVNMTTTFGKEVWFVCRFVPFQTEGQLYLLALITDITERKKAEEELKLFKKLLDQSNDAIFVIDPGTGRFLDVNGKACSSLGYVREELLQMAVVDVDDVVVLDILAWKSHAGEVKNKGQMILEGRHTRKDGTTFPVEINVSYVSLENKDYMIAVARDITERKEAEKMLCESTEKYKELFDSTLDGIYQVNADGVFILMNLAGARIFGYENPNEIIGRNALEYWRDPKDGEAFRAELKIKKTVSCYPMRAKKKNGEPIELESSSIIREDEEGNFLGIEGILRDVTEREHLEAQLRHAQKMEAVGTLAGGIAHDFNNILNVIMGFSTMVIDRIGDDQLSKEQMNEVLDAAERAANLTKRLLLFSRKEVTEFRPMDVNEMIINLEKMLSRIIGEDIDLVIELMGAKATVMGDAGQMEQVLMNLATNARDAMHKGGSLTIKTELREIDAEFINAHEYGTLGPYAVISIADTGTGIDKEKQARIFDPFFTTKEAGKGTGLGLSIAYGIVKQHNGYIKVYSETGKGTTFQIWLPVIEDSAEKKPEFEALSSLKGGTETILVAEDDASLRKLTRTVLEAFGYTVITAEDGDDAITKFMENKDKIALVVLDMIMPKKSGKEVSEVIREENPGTKILFVSGYTMDTIKTQELIDSGFDFIHKPVVPKDLVKKVREVLDA